VFLTGTGGLLDAHGDVIPSINLSTEYEQLMAPTGCRAACGSSSSRSTICCASCRCRARCRSPSPEELAKELFTHRGSGTLLRRGEKIRRATKWSQLDLRRLRALIESGFGRRLAKDYFRRTKLHRAFVSEHYRAALLITLEDGVPHLDKFAVAEDAQGEGLGRAAWLEMKAEVRACSGAPPDNAVNEFYFEAADGCIKGERWNVYWYGLEGFEQIERAVAHCRARPATLKP
jgi:acetylglutamate kinase